jgi:hypothetical protein
MNGHARFVAGLVALWLVGSAGTSPRAQTNQPTLRFTAMASHLSPSLNFPRQTPVQIAVTRWSSAGEQEQFTTVLKETGTDGLIDMLQHAQPVGTFRTPESINLDFHYAMRTSTEDGGQDITLITDRLVGFMEAYERPLRLDFRFVVMSLHVNPAGRGEGRISVATKIWVDRVLGEVMIQPYETDFIMLKDLRLTR